MKASIMSYLRRCGLIQSRLPTLQKWKPGVFYLYTYIEKRRLHKLQDEFMNLSLNLVDHLKDLIFIFE
jgi:hypothetical protein